jgi:hypothetical protein
MELRPKELWTMLFLLYVVLGAVVADALNGK